MGQTAIDTIEKSKGREVSVPEGELKAAFSRLAKEVNSQYQTGSATASEFITSAVRALKEFSGLECAELRINTLIDAAHYFYLGGHTFSALEPAKDAVELQSLFSEPPQLLLLVRLIDRPSLAGYVGLGAALGLGFCSKYMIVLFVPTAIAWLVASGNWRKVSWAHVPLTIATGLAFCFPVLWWNFKNDWASIRFQLDHGLHDPHWSWDIPSEYIFGQLFIVFPVVIWFATRPGRSGAEFLQYFAWIPLSFFLYTSFKARVEANWPVMAHPALLSLAFLKAPQGSRWLKATSAIWIFVSILTISEVAYHWIPVDPRNLKTSELTRYDIYLPFTKDERKLYLSSYQAAAAISYKLRRQFYKLNGSSRRDFYDFLPESLPKDDKFLFGAERFQPMSKAAYDTDYYEVATRLLNEDFRIAEVQRAQNPHR